MLSVLRGLNIPLTGSAADTYRITATIGIPEDPVAYGTMPFEATVNGCRVGTLGTGDLPALKTGRILSSNMETARSLDLLRCPGCIKHGHLEGKYTEKSGNYSMHFAREIIEAILQGKGNSTVRNRVLGL